MGRKRAGAKALGAYGPGLGGATAVEPPEAQGDTLVDLFERQAAAWPNAVALTSLGESCTYAELDAATNRLARRLVAMGVGPESLVAIALHRSISMIVAILATLKAGAAYVPLDPTSPTDRLAGILQDCAADILLTSLDVNTVPDGESLTVRLDDPAFLASLDGVPSTRLTPAERSSQLGPHNLAYVIYTSGSTGRPKGVSVTHHNVARLFSQTSAWYGFGPQDVWTLFHSYAFDFSVWEIWGALLYGGRLVIVDEETRRTPSQFLELLARERVTVLNQTPSAFYQLLVAVEARPELPLSLRYIIFGGEALDFRRLSTWYRSRPKDKTRLVNMYGITETTVHVTYFPIRPEMTEGGDASLIGEPIPDLAVYVLDESLAPVPTGQVGELYVAGDGVARGYLNRPQLTAERFIDCPFEGPHRRMYKTGDLARRREDGGLEYLGRADQQVKIRGFRIEPGEIEAALVELEGVGQAAVIAREIAGDMKLVAYLVEHPDGDLPDPTTIRAHLSVTLQEHMIPSAFVPLPALPLTTNGKLDRAALPEPSIGGGAPYREPRDETEQKLCQLFARLTGAETVGVDDNFFDLGGHSLLGVRLLREVETEFGVTVPLGLLFAAPTVAQFARKLERAHLDQPWVSLVPIQTQGAGSPVFLIHWIMRDLARHLAGFRPVYGLSYGLASETRHTQEQMPSSIEALAAHYIEEMRKLQPQGPYYLVGHSAGGVVAFEMAQQLRAAGEEVALLGLLDTCAPNSPSIGGRLGLMDTVRNILRRPLRDLVGSAKFRAREQLLRIPPVRRLLMEGQTLPTVLRLRLVNQFINDYKPRSYSGRIDFFKSLTPPWTIRHAPPPPFEDAWTGIAEGGMRIHGIPGDHMEIVKDPVAGETAAVIRACLAG